ncbi:MAG TPA: hypothetical protein VD838_11680, partial [Anaeromyxobacteraceae bacterium]|nr:hypothetical protein [Anaeromyxobacteraceae bacterium]
MKTRPLGLSILLSALVVLTAACATTRGPSGTTRATASHPDVGAAAATEACATCHEGATPAIANAWAASAHGMNLVRCFVCHGSTGADFTASPATDRCSGCHAQQAERVAARPESASCFACH